MKTFNTCIELQLINELTKKQIEHLCRMKNIFLKKELQKINTSFLKPYVNNFTNITNYAFGLLKGKFNTIKNFN